MSKLQILHQLEKENNFLELSVTYQLGGMNWSSSNPDRRGIYLHFTTKEITNENGYTLSRMSLFGDGNCKIFIKELTRKSKKQEELFFKFVTENKDSLINAFYENRQDIFKILENYK